MIEIQKINILCKGKFLEFKEIFFKYKGKNRVWEVCSSMNSVSVLIYDKDLDSIILVKQFRLPVFLKNKDGFTYELCAGLCDKDMSEEMTAKEEILEECGYDVEVERLEKITVTYSNVGSSGSKQSIFYVEVGNKDKVHTGGGIDDEDIEVVELKRSEIEKFIFDENKVITPGAKFALLWWIHYKMKS